MRNKVRNTSSNYSQKIENSCRILKLREVTLTLDNSVIQFEESVLAKGAFRKDGCWYFSYGVTQLVLVGRDYESLQPSNTSPKQMQSAIPSLDVHIQQKKN
jgi:hypothetical protein